MTRKEELKKSREEVTTMTTFKLSQCVSQITVSKDAKQEPAFTLIRDCTGARVVQK